MQKTVIETHEHVMHICDICGSELGYHRCLICGKDVCLKCSTPVSEVRMWRFEYGDCDYPTIYCKACWDNGKEFRERLNQIDAIRDAGEDCIFEAWRESVKSE